MWNNGSEKPDSFIIILVLLAKKQFFNIQCRSNQDIIIIWINVKSHSG